MRGGGVRGVCVESFFFLKSGGRGVGGCGFVRPLLEQLPCISFFPPLSTCACMCARGRPFLFRAILR